MVRVLFVYPVPIQTIWLKLAKNEKWLRLANLAKISEKKRAKND